MAVAQGISHVCWFEAEDPHGEPPGYGLLDINGNPRASATAMKAMTDALGETPKYQGWLALGQGARSYGFVFQGTAGPVLALWMPARSTDNTITFTGDVQIVDPLTGNVTPLKTGQSLSLTNLPVLVTGLPGDLVAQAQANAAKNFPWGGDYSNVNTVSLQLGPNPVNQGVACQGGNGISVVFPDGSTGEVVQGTIGGGANFYVHPSFASVNTREYYIRLSFRSLGPGSVGMNFSYEVADSQGDAPMRHSGGWYSLTPDSGWQTHVWHVTDASFAKMWGVDFGINPEKSVPFVVGKVEVSTQPFAN